VYTQTTSHNLPGPHHQWGSLERAGSTRLQDIVAERRFRLAGHILRFPDHRHSKSTMGWTLAGGTRRRGHPKKTWRRTFQEDLAGCSWLGNRQRSWLQTDYTSCCPMCSAAREELSLSYYSHSYLGKLSSNRNGVIEIDEFCSTPVAISS